MEVNGARDGLATNILQNIFFCLPLKKSYRNLTGLEFHFCVDYAFKDSG